MKRCFDVFGSSFLLACLWPVMVLVGIAIRLSSEGPMLFRGVRIGRDGAPFVMYKFRTMVSDAETRGGPSTSEDDPRVTGVGRVLRRWKLDELPQLWNVLIGEMSFVGPRPEVSQEVSLYTEEERKLLSVLPGITDFASIRFRNEGELLRGASDPHEAYRRLIRPEKINLGLKYVRTRSFVTDMRILWLTVKAVLRD